MHEHVCEGTANSCLDSPQWLLHVIQRALTSSLLFFPIESLLYESHLNASHLFLHHLKSNHQETRTNSTLAPWGLYRKHFRKTHGIQPAMHCISITERYALSCRDVLLCLANITHLPKIMVSIQIYGLKFHTEMIHFLPQQRHEIAKSVPLHLRV